MYQTSKGNYFTVRNIKGSPCYLIRECIKTNDSPTGFYENYGDTFVRGVTPDEALHRFLQDNSDK